MLTLKNAIGTLAALAAGTVLAAGGKGVVAPGFVDWQGVNDGAHVIGRTLTPSDLRHKYAVVVEIENDAKLRANLLAAADVVKLQGGPAGGSFVSSWASYTIPRNVIVVFSCHGKKLDAETLRAALSAKDVKEDGLRQTLNMLCNGGTAYYNGLTFDGAPDATGKRPYLYVLPPTGTAVAFQGPATAAGARKARDYVAGKAKGLKWAPFSGSVGEPAHFKAAWDKVFASTKPLTPVAPLLAALKKGIASHDEATATEAQVLYDALEQTRGDLVCQIRAEAESAPYRAAVDIATLLKYWPGEKKSVVGVLAQFKADPDLKASVDAYCQLKAWSAPGFTCRNAGEAKKIVAQLNAMKKRLVPLADSGNARVQAAASVAAALVDELIETMPTKVPQK